ncbi:PREDICTED: uncharacterized protein LOC108972848 isoform X2 [Bactrocera latifrons]|uniref:uncharacterized protein LOC108972848 isoform X2 n=1 Tax=Bactrocera latifrons TaxID=174628 RepID=UPI0008DD67E6|nr:PREDICTED: uncharacterized protein LOC108972848 isoform X2 [Bactrocera latifrons]
MRFATVVYGEPVERTRQKWFGLEEEEDWKYDSTKIVAQQSRDRKILGSNPRSHFKTFKSSSVNWVSTFVHTHTYSWLFFCGCREC